MSTFFHNDSPLLSGQTFPQLFNSPQENPADPYNVYRQQLLNNYMAQQNQNQTPTQHDYLNELEITTKGLDRETIERLNAHPRYSELNAKLQTSIQEEIMNMVKSKINSNSELTNIIKEQMEIITKIKTEVKEEERNNYYEMQDYLKNYSHLTFDDYKKLKNKKIVENVKEE